MRKMEGKTNDALVVENTELRARLHEAEEALEAIRSGEVDALVVSGEEGKRVFTLQGAEQPYRTMIERMSEGAAVLTKEGAILYCNSRFAEMIDAPMEGIMGTDSLPFIAPADRPTFLEHLAQARSKIARGEIYLQSRSGKLIPVQVALSGLEIAGNQSVCLVATDLTEYKLNIEMRREAEAVAQAKDDFIAMLSHELRNPLSPVLIASGDCESDTALAPELRGIFRMIRENIESEARLIDDLLDHTRIRRGKMHVHLETIDLHQVLDQVIKTMMPDFRSRKLQFITELKAERHNVRGDAGRLTQVFLNLLKNALKFTAPSGTVHLRSRNQGKRIQIEITDTGIGIEPDVIGKIFDPFAQGKQRGDHKFGGLGLGLAISKALVDLHEASITAFSKGKGKGATFTVELATVAATPKQSETPPAFIPREEQSRRILLVDDHEATLQTLSRILRRWGYGVETAICVKEALDVAAKKPFDLLISDVGLPDGSGLDIMHEVKERYGLRGIALSGYGTEEDIRQSRDAGFGEHLIKPISFTSLRSAIQRTVPH